MKILMILDNEFPPDSRVEKEINSLLNIAEEVHVAAYTRVNKPLLEKKDGLIIHRKPVSQFGYKTKAFPLVLPLYFQFWNSFVDEICQEHDFEIVISHDLPMARIANRLKREKNLFSICDQHEYYSDWIVDTQHMNTLPGKVVKTLSNWKKFECKELSYCDLVLTVAEPLRKNYIKEHNIPENKILTIPNTPSKSVFNNTNIKKNIVSKFEGKDVILYAGGMDILRGIDVAIKALPYLIEDSPNIELVLCGNLVNTYNPFDLAEKLGVSSYINHIGWVNEDDLPSYMAASKICFFTPPSNRDEINMTIATKIYQYAIMQKPMIIGRAKLMKDYVESNGLGYSINETKPQDFADKAKLILKGDFKLPEDANFVYWEDTTKPLLDRIKTLSKKKK